jgi:hypothetical protein
MDKRRTNAQFSPAEVEFRLRPLEVAPLSLTEKLTRHRHPMTGFLFSLFVHTLLIGLFLTLAFSFPDTKRGIHLDAELQRDELQLNDQPTSNQLSSIQIDLPNESTSPLEQSQLDQTMETETPLADMEAETVSPIADASRESTIVEPAVPEAPTLTLPTGGGLAGRDPAARGALAASQGGSQASEQAVEDGLRWLAAHQGDDGSWGFHHQKSSNCNCPHEGQRESKTAATGLSLLAFLGAGYTHRLGSHQAVVAGGLKYLTQTMRNNGSWLGDSDKMYAHAIATIALAEAYQLSGDEELAQYVEKARRYIELAQNTSDSNRRGSWGYVAGNPGDITVTAWHLMALKSCKSAGMPTKNETWDLANRFVDYLGSSDGTFGYDQPKKKTPSTTAIGLFSKMHLGLHRESPILSSGGDWLLDQGPSTTDLYFNYYATQVIYHRQGEDWIKWNQQLRDYLVSTQATGAGHLAGSWHFEDKHGDVGGRLYSTAIAILTLEVYYRYLPLYENLVTDSDSVPRLSGAGEPVKSR